MSLNPGEQALLDYVLGHRDERQFWQEKVRQLTLAAPNDLAAAVMLEAELRRYFHERSQNVRAFRDFAGSERRMGFRSLAEYWIRLWTLPRANKPKPGPGEGSENTWIPGV